MPFQNLGSRELILLYYRVFRFIPYFNTIEQIFNFDKKFNAKLKHKCTFRSRKKERKKNVNDHNYDQWIGVEKDLLVIELHTIYFVNITVMKRETLRLMKKEFILSIFFIFK